VGTGDPVWPGTVNGNLHHADCIKNRVYLAFRYIRAHLSEHYLRWMPCGAGAGGTTVSGPRAGIAWLSHTPKYSFFLMDRGYSRAKSPGSGWRASGEI